MMRLEDLRLPICRKNQAEIPRINIPVAEKQEQWLSLPFSLAISGKVEVPKECKHVFSTEIIKQI